MDLVLKDWFLTSFLVIYWNQSSHSSLCIKLCCCLYDREESDLAFIEK